MSLLGLIVLVAVVGFICWVITNYIPMDAKFKQLIVVIAIVGLIFYLLVVTNLLPAIPNMRIGR